jgi:hypothetical protein
LSYQRRGSSGYLVARRKGNYPIQVVAGTHFRTKKQAQKKVDQLKRAYEDPDVKFMVRKEGWRRKRWWP